MRNLKRLQGVGYTPPLPSPVVWDSDPERYNCKVSQRYAKARRLDNNTTRVKITKRIRQSVDKHEVTNRQKETEKESRSNKT